MNFIAGFLLSIVENEHHAYFLFEAIINKYLAEKLTSNLDGV